MLDDKSFSTNQRVHISNNTTKQRKIHVHRTEFSYTLFIYYMHIHTSICDNDAHSHSFPYNLYTAHVHCTCGADLAIYKFYDHIIIHFFTFPVNNITHFFQISSIFLLFLHTKTVDYKPTSYTNWIIIWQFYASNKCTTLLLKPVNLNL